MATVFLTGGTGYMGRALVRDGSESKLVAGCEPVCGADTFVHLVGVAHPGPSKAREFQTVDLASVRAAVVAALIERGRAALCLRQRGAPRRDEGLYRGPPAWAC